MTRALALTLAAACSLALAANAESDGTYLGAMADAHRSDEPIASPAARRDVPTPIEGHEVVYGEVGGRELRGYLARPEGAQSGAPGVIVIHEWWGLNDNIRSMARQLAGAGYTALAVDLYDGSVTDQPARARELATHAMTDSARARENLRQAHHHLVEEQGAKRTGSVGWCFGGGWSLEMALLKPGELDAAVIYYGRLVTDRGRLATLRTPLLGHFGSEDEGIPVAKVKEFEEILQKLDKSVSIKIYPGADHAFANPSGRHYQAGAADRAWARTLSFLAEHLAETSR